MEQITVWQFVNSGAVLLLLGFVVRFTANFTTMKNLIGSLTKTADEAGAKAASALEKLNHAELKTERLEGQLNTMRETHDGFASWLDKIEGKIDKLTDKLDDHQRREVTAR